MNRGFTIEDRKIFEMMKTAENAGSACVEAVLDKARKGLGLQPNETAVLLACEDNLVWQQIYEIAGHLKQKIYGDRVVLFAPLYVSDYCVNNCVYCGFRNASKKPRRKLTQEEVRDEVRALIRMGHKRLALEAGEDPANCPIEYILECIETIYGTQIQSGVGIRRINVNIAATTVENYRKLKEANIGTYILFQETYHKKTFEKYHISGPKTDYTRHIAAMDTAMTAGIDDVGGGVLFGLYDYKYEVLALMEHNNHLEREFGTGFHTISVPRVKAAAGDHKALPHDNESTTKPSEFSVTDEQMRKIIAVLRVSVPQTGIILSTRETADMRKELIQLGVSQISGGSCVEVKGYSGKTLSRTIDSNSETALPQFEIEDNRNAADIIYWLMEEGFVPSFCTACYRKNRTGATFMHLAKHGQIKNVCLPNALLTLREYAEDYGDEKFMILANTLIEQKLEELDEPMPAIIEDGLAAIKNGERDVYI